MKNASFGIWSVSFQTLRFPLRFGGPHASSPKQHAREGRQFRRPISSLRPAHITTAWESSRTTSISRPCPRSLQHNTLRGQARRILDIEAFAMRRFLPSGGAPWLGSSLMGWPLTCSKPHRTQGFRHFLSVSAENRAMRIHLSHISLFIPGISWDHAARFTGASSDRICSRWPA